ncbi:MAG: methylenetetrahydrofolate reductase [Nitrospirae bacterium]|nr:methylenetetrahydrofolate reductase [Nitrospirota bacterium]
MRKFQTSLKQNKFVVTAEFGPPKGTDIASLVKNGRDITGLVDGVNITDNQSGVMRACPLAISKILIDIGIDPILQVTCRDRNRLAIQSDLLGAHILGIRNLLALTGDPPHIGDHKDSKPVFDLQLDQLLGAVNSLNAGKDLAGNSLTSPTELFAGAATTPEADNFELECAKFEKKIESGAKFFQTQAIYNLKRFEEFMKHARKFQVKVIAGIILLKSSGMASFMNKNIPGIKVPEKLIESLEKAGKEKSLDVGIDIAVNTIKELKGMSDGVHIMAINAEHLLPQIIQKSGLA